MIFNRLMKDYWRSIIGIRHIVQFLIVYYLLTHLSLTADKRQTQLLEKQIIYRSKEKILISRLYYQLI